MTISVENGKSKVIKTGLYASSTDTSENTEEFPDVDDFPKTDDPREIPGDQDDSNDLPDQDQGTGIA